MKRLLTMIMGVLLFAPLGVKAAEIGDIVNALKQADPAEITKFFDSFVDIKLPNKDEVKNVSKNQASITLKDFYTEQGINGFELSSKREMGGTGYLVGKLKTDSRTFNVTIMVKTKGSTTTILSVRIN
ncbi:hypothetical protein A9P82_03725 [Arachidicoccus ginsenosidimutans]|uniref:DUF4783 domain-containing protein n=1 Tax=Arachidicoccus sp. BS20 TaxID=1850526 RepID=UPI0007F06CD7|nr:DUF4783 domain-containing protein [Arachidicoccus sp. BS20]ANI88483.1 hypothetical protein A9P82_03725 [Arachidicoccus sp. BS20]